MSEFKDYYAILGVQKDASTQVVTAAYRAGAKLYHPDTYHGDKSIAEDMIKELNIAYSELSTKSKRAKYDKEWEKHFGQSEKGDKTTNKKSTKKTKSDKNNDEYPESFFKEFKYPKNTFKGQLYSLKNINKAVAFLKMQFLLRNRRF